MKVYAICKSEESLKALRFAGIEGEKCDTSNAYERIINRLSVSDIGLVLISEDLYMAHENELLEVRLKSLDKLITMIPEPSGLIEKDYLMKTIKNSIGVKL